MQSDSERMDCGAAHPLEEGEGTALFCASRQVNGTGNLPELGCGGCDRQPGMEIKGVVGKKVRARPLDGYLFGGAGARPFATGVRCAFFVEDQVEGSSFSRRLLPVVELLFGEGARRKVPPDCKPLDATFIAVLLHGRQERSSCRARGVHVP